MHHVMSPTGVAVLLLLALVVDWMSIGPDSIRDRLAFFMGIVAIRQGFAGGPLDRWTVGALSDGINSLKHAASGSYIAGASTSVVLAAGVGCLAIYTVGCLVPNSLAKKLGKFASISFPASPMHRMNWRLWICAALLGMLAGLPQGGVGDWLRAGIDAITTLVSPLPNTLFGVN